jgi:hypothetical protein
VNLGLARCRAGEFFTQEEVSPMPERFHGLNGVMIRNSYQVHAALFQRVVQVERIAIAFATKAIQERNTAHARMERVDVQIAPHTPM